MSQWIIIRLRLNSVHSKSIRWRRVWKSSWNHQMEINRQLSDFISRNMEWSACFQFKRKEEELLHALAVEPREQFEEESIRFTWQAVTNLKHCAGLLSSPQWCVKFGTWKPLALIASDCHFLASLFACVTAFTTSRRITMSKWVKKGEGLCPPPPLHYDSALFSLLVWADLPASCWGQPPPLPPPQQRKQQQQQQQQQPKPVASISNEGSREIIDGNFEFASHYAGLEHFGLMRIKDSKAMHFISIRQTTRGRGRRGVRGEWNRGKETRERVWNQQAGRIRWSAESDVYGSSVSFSIILWNSVKNIYMIWHGKFFLTQTEGLRTEDVVHCTDFNAKISLQMTCNCPY